MTAENYLIIVLGPTASGKTSLAIDIARQFDTAIISADSRQFYKEMSIGTAKPTTEELTAAPHFFINNKSIQESYSVGDYEREVIAFLGDFFKNKHNIAVMAGGTGLYINAVCEGLNDFPDVPPSVRQALKMEFEQQGITSLQEELKKVDPTYFDEIDHNNPQRLIRALEIYRHTQRPFSYFKNQQKSIIRNFKPIKIALDWDRQVLYDRINRRVELMLQQGLVEEARELYPYKHLNALQTVGYQELFDFFDGIIDYEEAVRLIKRNTRRYAKRQLTWFRKDESITYFKPNELYKVIPFLKVNIGV